jgi:hypothetical protein
MFTRLSALWLVLGALVGYAVGGPSVRAQTTGPAFPFPVSPGDSLKLRFEQHTLTDGGYSFNCTVSELQGMWIRCKPADSFQREQPWYSLKRVIQVTKQEK